MNCQQFTSFIVEVARGQMMDAATRDGALRHAESCAACAARLAQEQSLTNALRTAALDMKNLSAPARVEAQLLAAFREAVAQPDATTATNALHAPVPLPAKTETRRLMSNWRARRAVVATTAIAASLVLVVLATLYLRYAQTTPQSPRELVTNARPPVMKASPPAGELTVATPQTLEPSIEPSIKSGQAATREMRVAKQVVASAPRATGKLARRGRTPTMIKAQHVIDGGNAIIEVSEGESAANNTGAAAKSNEAESMTDFISLVADAPAATPLESGQLVRVQVPRAALASLGLPLNAERGNEPVKADVLLGGDGLARAIRFVR
jgi:negative regulator of sigma E activity